IPVVLIVLATELTFLQDGLMTQSLTGPQWLVSVLLALVVALVIEADMWYQRRSAPAPQPVDVSHALTPDRARAGVPIHP
ncbi:MAG TPA: hypothetical protein VN257_10810, partial [Actinotalea sp.]|nr:hypothetical protein [Actinotalea sp.]